MAFFPTYLKRRYQLLKQAETHAPFSESLIPNCSEILTILRQNNYAPEPHFFLYSDSLTLDEITNEALYEIAINPELRKVQDWIWKRMLSTIGVETYRSIDVYTRIGTSMLNKLVEEGSLSKDLNIYYHDNFVRNTADLLCEISVEELPF